MKYWFGLGWSRKSSRSTIPATIGLLSLSSDLRSKRVADLLSSLNHKILGFFMRVAIWMKD